MTTTPPKKSNVTENLSENQHGCLRQVTLPIWESTWVMPIYEASIAHVTCRSPLPFAQHESYSTGFCFPDLVKYFYFSTAHMMGEPRAHHASGNRVAFLCRPLDRCAATRDHTTTLWEERVCATRTCAPSQHQTPDTNSASLLWHTCCLDIAKQRGF